MLEKNIKLSGKRVFVTGAGGFIGSNLCMELLREYSDIKILGFDSMNDYYDVGIKVDRLKKIAGMLDLTGKKLGEYGLPDSISGEEKLSFVKGNLADKEVVPSCTQHIHIGLNIINRQITDNDPRQRNLMVLLPNLLVFCL